LLDYATDSPGWLRLNYPYQHNIFLLVLYTVALTIVGAFLAYHSQSAGWV